MEVTTVNKAKRGAMVEEDAWAGWLYSGGHAVECNAHRKIVAMITSLNPAIGKNSSWNIFASSQMWKFL